MRFLIFFALSHSCCKKVLQIVIECQRKYYLNQKVRHFLKSGKSEGEFFFPDLEIYRSLWLDGKSSKSFSRRKDRPLISCGVLICCCHFSEAHELFIIKRVLRLSDIKIQGWRCWPDATVRIGKSKDDEGGVRQCAELHVENFLHQSNNLKSHMGNNALVTEKLFDQFSKYMADVTHKNKGQPTSTIRRGVNKCKCMRMTIYYYNIVTFLSSCFLQDCRSECCFQLSFGL